MPIAFYYYLCYFVGMGAVVKELYVGAHNIVLPEGAGERRMIDQIIQQYDRQAIRLAGGLTEMVDLREDPRFAAGGYLTVTVNPAGTDAVLRRVTPVIPEGNSGYKPAAEEGTNGNILEVNEMRLYSGGPVFTLREGRRVHTIYYGDEISD